MPTADAYIQALQRRMRLHAYRTRGRDGLPAGWEDWFQQPPAGGAGGHAGAIVAELAGRPPRPPGPAAADPGPWRAFAALWRPQWEPADPEDRPLRIFAGGFSLSWHLLLFFAMLWLLLTGYDPADAARQGEEDVIQVEFIGEGSPEEVGGGAGEAASPTPAEAAPPAPTPTAPAQAAARAAPVQEAATPAPVRDTPAPPEPAPQAPVQAAAASMPAPSFEVRTTVDAPALAAEAPAPVEREVPMPDVARQAVQVSEPVPDTTADFLLPPPTLEVDRALPVPQLQSPTREVAERDVPAPPRRLATPEIGSRAAPAAPELQLPSRTAREREVPMPATPLPPGPEVRRAPPAAPQPALEPSGRVARERAIPMPELPAPESATAAAAEAPAERTDDGAATGVPPGTPAIAGQGADAGEDGPPAAEAASGDAPGAEATAGPRPSAAPGGWPDPALADDWGASDRQRDGGQAGQPAGLFDSDGRVRLADTPGSSATGHPPGTITEEIENLDRAGTWLRRPPTDYEPTSFDRFWRPDETLLEEWVRRSVTTVRIPIPGSSKTIVCKTVLLAVGGACDIEDPNMVEQPASARPPPDIPFKPELQEGAGSGGAG